MSGLGGKSFAIPKQLVWQAWKSVKANSGAAGADGVTIEIFEKDLKDNLLQGLEPDVIGHVLPAAGAGGGDTQVVGRHAHSGRAHGHGIVPGLPVLLRLL